MPSMLGKVFTWRPAADVSETDKEFLIKAQLPGVDKENVNISFDRGILTIEGERKVNKSSDYEEIHRTESFYGKYSRSFSWPENIDEGNLMAESKDGVLTIHLPKLEKTNHEPKKYPVK